ncbi:MAG: bifunctional ADP-dependent NAD(P)H-hydrate dehydratase/NAD(P)H-hydrate epimerase, partial [Arenibacter sp.]|nr:bifunctional ADP-dependent NAD(P)H-hydrate dehydratase/NAD(P)H-hydrate epimerase [Arenibacter sp.]
LRAQGYSALHAAIFGVYLHGKAADIAVGETGFQALIASSILDYIGKSYLDLFKVVEPEAAKEEKEK